MKLTEFKGEKITFQETVKVKEGVVCDVYSFVNTVEKDIAIITIKAGSSTPPQKVLKGDKTTEGFISGKGILTVNDRKYTFPNATINSVVINVGDFVQWQAITDLVFFEECYPPYEDGRYENL